VQSSALSLQSQDANCARDLKQTCRLGGSCSRSTATPRRLSTCSFCAVAHDRRQLDAFPNCVPAVVSGFKAGYHCFEALVVLIAAGHMPGHQLSLSQRHDVLHG